MPNVGCVAAAKFGRRTRLTSSESHVAKLKRFWALKQRAGFATDCTVGAKELRSEGVVGKTK